MAFSLRPLKPEIYPPGSFQIPREARVFKVGREWGNDLRVNHSSVSALHARIESDGETAVEVVDCGSSNGTFVNGIQVKDRHRLSDGDLVRFATAEFRVTATGKSNGNQPVQAEETPRIPDESPSGETQIEVETPVETPVETQVVPESIPAEEVADPSGERVRLEEEILRLREELAVIRAGGEKSEAARVELEAELSRSRDEASAARASAGKAGNEVSSVRESLALEQALSKRLQRDLEESAQREQKLQSQISELRREVMDREGKIAALRYEITTHEGKVRQTEEQRLRVQAAYDGYVAACTDLEARLAASEEVLSGERKARGEAEAFAGEVRARLTSLAKRLLDDWKSWIDGDLPETAGDDVSAAFLRVETLADRIRGELDAIEPLWHEFGNGVQAELARRCGILKEEESGLLDATEQRRAELESADAGLRELRELIDIEVRRAQGLSRRGVHVEIPERFEAMVIARDREQAIFGGLVERLEHLDLLLEGYRGSRKLREVAKELGDFRNRLAAILDENGVRQFRIEPGTLLTLKHRREVRILSRKGWGTRQYAEFPFQPGEVVKVVRPGYQVGEGEDAVVLRKVEVLIRGVDD